MQPPTSWISTTVSGPRPLKSYRRLEPFAPELLRQTVRRVGRVADETGAVQARRRPDVLREVSGDAQHVPSAHAVADRADAARAHRLTAPDEIQDRAGVVDDHLVRQLAARRNHPLTALFVERVQRDHPVLRVAELVPHLALAVVEVRDQAVVPDGPDPARDLEQLVPHTPDVHIDDDGRKWPGLLGVRHERLHPAGRRLDGDEALFHDACDTMPRWTATSRRRAGGPC